MSTTVPSSCSQPDPDEFERVCTLKDGRAARLRRVRDEDVESCFELDRALVAAGEGQVRTTGDHPRTLDEFRERMEAWIRGDHSGYKGLYLVAACAGRIAGSGRIRRPALKRIRHNGTIGLGVHPEFQGLGLGRAIMLALIDWARNHSYIDPASRAGGITRLDLGVFADNHRAIRLYESLGFRRAGHRHAMIRRDDGTFIDDYEMELLLRAD